MAATLIRVACLPCLWALATLSPAVDSMPATGPYGDPWVGHVTPGLPAQQWWTAHPTTTPRTYGGTELTHVRMPIGGLGSGTVWLDGKGCFTFGQLPEATNDNDDSTPGGWFAIRAQATGSAPAVRVLQTTGLPGMTPFQTLEFEGGYPLARLRFHDPAFPAETTLTCFNPMIPGDAADSSLPCMVVRVTVRNPGQAPLRVQAIGSLRNLLRSTLPDGREVYGGNRGTLLSGPGLTGVSQSRDGAAAIEGLLDVQDAAHATLPGADLMLAANLSGTGDAGHAPGHELALLEAMGVLSRNGGGIVVNRATPAFLAAVSTAKAALSAETSAWQVIADFEGADFAGWAITGKAFAGGPCSGTAPYQSPVSNYRGSALVNSRASGSDGSVGDMTSPPFTITQRYLGMLVGGGSQAGVGVHLLIDGKSVRTAQGRNDETLRPAVWDLADLQGKEARISIIDQETGSYGHVLVDHIVTSNVDPGPLLARDNALTACDRLPLTPVAAAAAGPATVIPGELLHGLSSWRTTIRARLPAAAFPGCTVLASADGEPVVLAGPFGKATLVLVVADGIPADWTRRLLEIAWGQPIPADGAVLARSAHAGRAPYPHAAMAGTLTIASPDSDATVAVLNDDRLPARFAETGNFVGLPTAAISDPGQTVQGLVRIDLEVPPGQERTASFVIAWHFPYVARFGHPGNLYARRFRNADEVAAYACANLPALYQRTQLYHATMYQSNLPPEWIEAMTAQSAIMRGPTCFWSEDGYFGGYEGSYCSFPLNCTHVWGYAQAQARLFPEIGRTMRRADLLVNLHADGATAHRQTTDRRDTFIDGHYATILAALREHQLSPDDRFLREVWPAVRKAVEWQIGNLDPDHDGVIAGKQANTYDCQIDGSNTFIGSLYLASLAAAERMALAMGEKADAARWRTIRESGTRRQDEQLWNGEYYIQIPGQGAENYNNGCFADQLLGQWWMRQLGLGQLYPAAHERGALVALMRHNFRQGDYQTVLDAAKDLHMPPRPMMRDGDSGLLICTWPKGDRPERHIYYADEVWTGVEYAAAGTMIGEGLIDEARTLVAAVRARYDGSHHTWLHSQAAGNPYQDLEAGSMYARAMSSWGLLIAAQGLELDGPFGVIGFHPVWQPADHRSFFTAAEGWGLFVQQRTAQTQRDAIEVRHGRLRLRELTFSLPAGSEQATARLILDGHTIPAALVRDGVRAIVRPTTELIVAEGTVVETTFAW